MSKKCKLLVSLLVVVFLLPVTSAEAISISHKQIGHSCRRLGQKSTVMLNKVKVPVICRRVAKKKKWVRRAIFIPTTTSTTIPISEFGSVETLDTEDPLLRYIQIPNQPKRTYQIDLPNHFDPLKSYPLVIGLHGVSSTGKIIREDLGLDAVTLSNPVIAVYPDGSGAERDTIQSWNAGKCCSPSNDKPGYIRDVDFISIIISNMEKNFLIDPSRVWVLGHSNGGMMAYRLACEIPDQITGIAVGAAALTADFCSPSRAVSIIHLQGELDTKVPLMGGGPYNTLSVMFSIEYVANAVGCTKDAANVSANSQLWQCPDSMEAQLLIDTNQAHDWNSNWTEIMVQFLQSHPRV